MADIENPERLNRAGTILFDPKSDVFKGFPENAQAFTLLLILKMGNKPETPESFYEDMEILVNDLQVGIDSRTGQKFEQPSLVCKTPYDYNLLKFNAILVIRAFDKEFGEATLKFHNAFVEAKKTSFGDQNI